MWFNEAEKYVEDKTAELVNAEPDDIDGMVDNMLLEMTGDPETTTVDAEATLSLDNWRTRVEHTVLATDGSFKVSWYSEVKGSLTNKKVEARVIVDDTDVIAGTVQIPVDGSNYYSFSGKKKVYLSTGVHTIKLETKRESPSSVTVRKAEISTRRVR